jgi:transcriptional regulator with XRE-family HTH domain
MVHIHTETLGDIIKKARQESGITMEELAFRLDLTPRYLYKIENENKKPSFDVLYNLIRELSISPDSIFYPERLSTDSELENLIRRLYSLDERSLDVIKATANALLETAITSSNPKK